MEKYLNQRGIEYYTGVEPNTPLAELNFHKEPTGLEENSMVAVYTNLGNLTVLHRRTGFGYFDTETGYRAPDGKFWLASGGRDVRQSGAVTFQDAIDWVKEHADICCGD